MKESHQKKLTRLYVPERLTPQHMVLLTPDQSHHLLTVLRKKAGDQVLLFNGMAGEWLAVLTSVSKKQISARCLEQVRPQ